jgi:nucleotide-binding universal stress UspA family protein
MAQPRVRKFLVVIDKTPECAVALRFATRRAQHTGGRVTLMCAAMPGEFQQWKGVEEIMRDEAHAEAEALLHAAAKTVNDLSGILPELVIPYGTITDCLAKLLKDDKDISILVLASGTGKEGPGPLVSLFTGAAQSIPVTIVPGNFTDQQIDALA